MAARKKSTRDGRSRRAQTNPVLSDKRTPTDGRATDARIRTATVERRALRKENEAAPAERREGTHQGKPTSNGGAKKTLDHEMTVLAVEGTTNGHGDATLQAMSPQESQVPSQESPLLNVEKTDPATVPGTKATEMGGAAGSAPPAKSASSTGKQKPAPKDDAASASRSTKARQGFKMNEFVVYPAHGVGQIVAIEEQEVAGFKLELFVISFSKDKMTLRVPTAKVAGVGMRKISDPDTAKRSLDILGGRARVKRTMWSRRAQEYETKINSGDIASIAEVVRDLYRSEAQPEQSYSERQLYEAALDRMVREIAAVQKSNEIDALKAIEAQLQKTHNRPAKGTAGEVADPEIEEAA